MCGVAGIVMASGHPAETLLSKAASAIAHRGPDGHAQLINNGVGLVHARLAIIDLEGGDQPLSFSNNNSSYHLVANGEIYNYLELAKDYRQQGNNFVSDSDCELILHAYADKGLEGIKLLNGMFAFALHDERKQQVILARDRLGIKPLYFAKLNDSVIFSSEIKGLLALMPQQPSVRKAAIADYLQNQFNSGRETIFENVYRVLPGECISIDTSTLNLNYQQYWSPFDIVPVQIDQLSAMHSFEGLFEQVMTEHMRSDVSYGLFLSGGIDSSLILAALDRWQADPIRTYSIGYSGVAMKDELDQAESLAKHFNTEHVSLRVTRDDLFNRIVHSVWSTDDLMRDMASLPTSLLSERAAKDIKVVFSGEGGDEAFAGYRRYSASVENWLKGIVRGTGGFRTRGQWQDGLPAKALCAELKAIDTRRQFKDIWQQAPKSWSNMQRRQVIDLLTALPDNLFVKGDRTMMSFGLEGRVPFSDHRIVEFGLALPDQLKMKGTTGKQLLRQWGQSVLSAELLARPKSGFHVPINEWLSGSFLKQLEQKILGNRAVMRYFNIEGVRQLFAAQRNGKNVARHIWCMMQIGIWHQLFVESVGSKPSAEENPLDWL